MKQNEHVDTLKPSSRKHMQGIVLILIIIIKSEKVDQFSIFHDSQLPPISRMSTCYKTGDTKTRARMGGVLHV